MKNQENKDKNFAYGGMTTNESLLHSFLTSNREAKVGNLSTHYNEHEDLILLRNYGTLIATRKDKLVKITETKYSKTTTNITNKLQALAKDLGYGFEVLKTDEFEVGGELENEDDKYMSYGVKIMFAGLSDEDKNKNIGNYIVSYNAMKHLQNQKELEIEVIGAFEVPTSSTELYQKIWRTSKALGLLAFGGETFSNGGEISSKELNNGYQYSYSHDEDNSGQLYKEHGIYQVNGFENGEHFFNSYEKLSEAKEDYLSRKKGQKFANGGITIAEIKRRTSETSPHYFDKKSMKFFGQTMKDFKVYKMDDGRYKISAPMRNRDGEVIGKSERIFNPENNKLELLKEGGELNEKYDLGGLSDVSDMLPNPNDMSVINPMEKGGEADEEENESYDNDYPEWANEALEALKEEEGDESLVFSREELMGGVVGYTIEGDTGEYLIFESEDDAEQFAIATVKEDAEENPEIFNTDFLLEHMEVGDFFKDIFQEWNVSYANDIMTEESDNYPNRLIEEMVDNGIMTEEEAEGDDAVEIAEERIDDFASNMTNNQLSEGNEGYDHYSSNIGEEEAKKLVIDNNLIDLDELSKDAVGLDGIPHFLARYDGNQIDLGNAVAYRTN